MSACTDLPAAVGFALGLYFQITQTSHWVRFVRPPGTRKLWVRCAKPQHGPPSTRLQNPDRKGRALDERLHDLPAAVGFALGLYFQITQTSHWVRFFRPPEPTNAGFVARKRRAPARPAFRTPTVREGSSPLGSYFQLTGTQKLWLRCAKPRVSPYLVPQKAPRTEFGANGGEQPCISEISNARRSSSRRTHQIQAPNFCRTGRSSGHSDNPPGDE